MATGRANHPPPNSKNLSLRKISQARLFLHDKKLCHHPTHRLTQGFFSLVGISQVPAGFISIQNSHWIPTPQGCHSAASLLLRSLALEAQVVSFHVGEGEVAGCVIPSAHRSPCERRGCRNERSIPVGGFAVATANPGG